MKLTKKQKKTVKRYVISTAETFGVTFALVFLTLLESALESGEQMSFALFAGMASGAVVAASKVVVKYLRELVQGVK